MGGEWQFCDYDFGGSDFPPELLSPRETYTTMKTLISVVLDESASMAGSKGHTAVSALNEFIQGQQALVADQCELSITKFNDRSMVALPTTPIAFVPKLVYGENYRPHGNTALLDAILETIEAAERVPLILAQRDRHLIVVLTDGEENASRRQAQPLIDNFAPPPTWWAPPTRRVVQASLLQYVKKRIEQKEGLGNWSFVYLSASPSAFGDAAGMGFSPGNTVSFTNNGYGTEQAVHYMSLGTASLRKGMRGQSMSYSADTVAEARATGMAIPDTADPLGILNDAKKVDKP